MGKYKTRWAAAAAVAVAAGMVGATVAAGAPPAAAATKSAFVIGFMNSTQGAVQFPGISDGAQAAVQYVNARGGINGHPLVLAVCDTDATPEKNQACAQQFANDPRLKMVNVGFTLTPGPFYSALTPSGLPVMQSFPTTQSDFNAPNSVAYNGGAPASTVGGAEIANSAKAQSVAFMLADTATAQVSVNYYTARFKGPKSGIKTVLVPLTATDVLPYLVQGGVPNTDFVSIGVTNCLPFAKALAQLKVPGTKVGAASSCLSSANIAGPSASLFEGWRAAFYYQDAVFGPGVTKDIDVLLANYPKYAKLPTTPGYAAFVSQGWGPILTLQNVLRGTPDNVLNDKKALFKKLHSYRGPGTLTAPTMKCGSVSGSPSLCTLWTMKGQNRGGKFYRVAG